MPLFMLKLIALPRWAKGLGLIALAIAAFLIWLHSHDRGVIEDNDTKREAAAAVAREDAATERVTDAATNAANEKDLHNAIDNAPKGNLSPASHALACERLRKVGRIPTACRPAGGN